MITALADGAFDTGWQIRDEVSISNSHLTHSAELAGISDNLSEDGSVAIDCGSLVAIPAGSSAVCSYEKVLSSGNAQINAAKVLLRNFGFHPRQDPVSIGTT